MTMNKSKSLPWDEVEKAIYKEIKWLEDTIMESHFKHEMEVCSECIFRRIAVLILSGKIKVKDIKSSVSLFGRNKSFVIGKPHGKEWHSEMMKLVASYFKYLGYDVAIEPNLDMGRADLGIYKNGERNLFIEVGTISLPKLLHNFTTMEGSDFLLVLDSKHAVEISILEADFDLNKVYLNV